MVKRKIILTIFLAIIVAAGMILLRKVNADIAYQTAQGGEGTQARCTPQKIIKNAKAEVGKKYYNDITPYGNDGNSWCAYFAVWVYKKSGCSIKKEGNSRALLEWFASTNPPVLKDPLQAKGGDIIVWKGKSGSTGHTGIVVNNDTSKQLIWTIEGNSNQDKVMIRKYSYKEIQNRNGDYYKLYGFGRLK